MTSSARKIHDVLESNYRVWKARQLMSEVLIWQFQQEAVRDALEGKLLFADSQVSGSLMNSRLSIVPVKAKSNANKGLLPLEMSVTRIEAFNVSQKVWADQQSLYFRLSLGGWVVRTPSIVYTGRPIDIENPDIKVLIPREDLKLHQLKVEVFEENLLLDDKRVAIGKHFVSDILGHNIGNTLVFDVEMTVGRGVPGGIVRLSLRADYEKEKPAYTLDPGNYLGIEQNNNMVVLNPKEIVSGERDERMPPKTEFEHGGIEPNLPKTPSTAAAPVGDGGCNEDGSAQMLDQDSAGTQQLPDQAQEASVRLESEVSMDETVSDGVNPLENNGPITARTPSQHGGSILNEPEDVLSGVFPSLADQQTTFGGIVSSLRGSGDGLIKMLVGDVALKDIWEKGGRVGEHAMRVR
jgi:hypothetical protein